MQQTIDYNRIKYLSYYILTTKWVVRVFCIYKTSSVEWAYRKMKFLSI